MPIERITFTPGYITLYDGGNNPTAHKVSNLLRALDIPAGLTYTQVQAITTLANLAGVLIRTLIARDILDDSFLEDGEYNLESITEAIGQMGGDYGEPDLSVTEG
jgi:hypothetical protein